jgi:hypothetical protein|tara:strand:- start:112 stop:525 length:414 start_codon:yes stop_codon:yes gene_type:complete
MNSELMLLPLLGQVILTFCVGFLARIRREKSVKEGFNWRYFKTFEGEKPPRYVLQADQHLVNLFEVPMLFFAAGILAISLDTVDTVILLFASIYVISRVIHAIISLTNNRLLWRARVFIFSTIIILMMWFWLIYLNF